MPTTPADQASARVDYFPAHTAFPNGRRVGIRIVASRPAQASLAYGPPDRSAAQGDLCHEAPASPSYPAKPLVSFQINRRLLWVNLLPLMIRAFGAHGQFRTCEQAVCRTCPLNQTNLLAKVHLIKQSVIGVRMATAPLTKYAKCGDMSIAYQVVGDAPLDVIIVLGGISNIEVFWELAEFATWITRLASFCHVISSISVDLGCPIGTSIQLWKSRWRTSTLSSMLSVRAVSLSTEFLKMRCLAILFAATYPERVQGLVLNSSCACDCCTRLSGRC